MGFVVEFSSDLILFHVVNSDTLKLNGYSVVREEDVEYYRAFDKRGFWQAQVVQQLGLKPVRPNGILLSSLPDLLKSIGDRYALITIHPEKRKPDVCFIGPLLSLSKVTFTIDDLNSSAEWTGPRRIRYADVTRVDFDGGYERGLASVAPKRDSLKRNISPDPL